MKLLAIDGNSIINRAFYGIRLLSTKSGVHTNAVYGFINILFKLVEMEHPDSVAVAFDLKAPTFRHKMYEEYKAGRHPSPEELKEQFPLLKKWLTLAGYTVIECEGYEADDILGTLARICEDGKNECVIATGDRDSLQLISDSTRVLLSATKQGQPEITNFTKELLLEVYGLSPDGMIELKSLMGDSSDNIPGVAGIGQKTATELVKSFGTIDYIYRNIDSIDIKDSVRNKLISGRESAYLSRTLGTICKTAPISGNIEDYLNKPQQTEELSRFMTELELNRLMDRMGLIPCFDAKPEGRCEKEFSVCDFSEIENEKSFDIYENCCVSGDKIAKLTDERLSKLMLSPVKKRVYDYKNICKTFGDVKGVTFDLLLAGYICSTASKEYTVPSLSEKYGIGAPKIDEDFKSAALFSLLCDTLTKELQKTEQLSLLSDIELPLARVLADMENCGFLVDAEGFKKMGTELDEKIAQMQSEIYLLAGEEFNINSPKQLGVILFEKLNLPFSKKTKSGYSTNADVLDKLKDDYKIVELILKYRQMAKLKSTYCDGMLSAISNDGRIHSTFNQTEARTGRISSLEPNLQNIPVRTEEGKRLREFFTAPDGYVLCDADYSQIELRVLASVAEDEVMINAFESGTDIHTVTASEVFNIPIDMVLPIMRSRAKAVNFGIVYGIGAFSLAKDIGVTNKEAKQYIEGYLNTYKGVAKYMERVIESAKTDGFVTTAFGRRRYIPELNEKNGMLRQFGERVARNAPIQGTAADIIKIAMIRVNERLKKELPDARLILQVHDELIVECPENKATIANGILEEEMQNAAKLRVKLTVDAHSGKNWLIAKG